jgi:hypothetical protein
MSPLLLTLLFTQISLADTCVCKCVTKTENGSYATTSGEGKNREKAGENLKKNLGKKKCELTPDCIGACSLDQKKANPASGNSRKR